MDYQAVIAVAGTVIVAYVMLGGMKSVALTDTLQGLLFISLLWVIVIACLMAGFGGSLPKAVGSIWEIPENGSPIRGRTAGCRTAPALATRFRAPSTGQ